MFNISIFFFSSRRRHTRSYGDWSSDVCSSDLLPRMDGITVCRMLKSDPITAQVPLYMLTAKAKKADVEEIGRASCRERGEIWGGGELGKKKKTMQRMWHVVRYRR